MIIIINISIEGKRTMDQDLWNLRCDIYTIHYVEL